MTRPRAMILGLSGPRLAPAERDFFRAAQPLGFILFKRNCEAPAQLGALVGALRAAVGRADAPVLIDQEGGRVARLGPPHWRLPPPAAAFGRMAARAAARAGEAARLNARLIADDLRALGISVDCTPVLDVPAAGAHDVIGERAFARDPDLVAALGRAVCEGMIAGGVLPVIKHIPGHGRAACDTHRALPVVATPEAELARTDFKPFAALADMPWAMTAHVVFSAIDSEAPATTSRTLIARVIRGHIGFGGLLVSDDLGMQALEGGMGARAASCLAAGCDVALHCSGKLEEMQDVARATPPLRGDSMRRLERGQALLRAPESFERRVALARLDEMMVHA